MNYSETKALFSSELPQYYEAYFSDFEKAYDADSDIIPEDVLSLIRKETDVPEGCINMIRAVRDRIRSEEKLHFAAMFYLYATVLRRKPWENYLYSEDILPVEGFAKESVNLLFVAFALAHTLTVKRPPKELNQTNLDAFRGYSSGCLAERGYWGINEYHWSLLCCGGCMFMQGALKFCPGYFTNDFPVFTDGSGKNWFSTVSGEYGITKYGELTGDESESVAHTVFEETEDSVLCNRISKDGKVSLTPERLDRAVWKDYLRGGTPPLDIHIPPHMDYRPEVMADAYRKAYAFYRSFYPDHEVKAVSGYSWIFSPQLRLVLGPESRILAVMDSMHILPTTGTYSSDLRFLRPGSALCSRIEEAERAGRKFHFGVMYVPVSEFVL